MNTPSKEAIRRLKKQNKALMEVARLAKLEHSRAGVDFRGDIIVEAGYFELLEKALTELKAQGIKL